MKQEEGQLPTIFIANFLQHIRYADVDQQMTEIQAVKLIKSSLTTKWQREFQHVNCKTIGQLMKIAQEAISFNRIQQEGTSTNKLLAFCNNGDLLHSNSNKPTEQRLMKMDPMLYRQKNNNLFKDKKKAESDSNNNSDSRANTHFDQRGHNLMNKFNRFRAALGKPNLSRFHQNNTVNKYGYRGQFSQQSNPRYNNNSAYQGGNRNFNNQKNNSGYQGRYPNSNYQSRNSQNTTPNNNTQTELNSEKKDLKPTTNNTTNTQNTQNNGFNPNRGNFNRNNTQHFSGNRPWPNSNNNFRGPKAFCCFCNGEDHSFQDCDELKYVQETYNYLEDDEPDEQNDTQNDEENSQNDNNGDDDDINYDQDNVSIEGEKTAMKCIKLANHTFTNIENLLNDKSNNDLLKHNINDKEELMFDQQINCVDACQTNKSEKEGDLCLTEVFVNDTKLIAILDCGANCNIIDNTMHNKLKNTSVLEESSEVLLVVGSRKKNVLRTKLWVKLACHESPVLFDFFVMPKIPFIILGTYFLSKMGIDLIISQKSYMHKQKLYPFLNTREFKKLPNKFVNRVSLNESRQNDVVNFNNLIESLPEKCGKYAGQFSEILNSHREIFSEIPAIAKNVEFAIDLKEGCVPKKLNAYPANPMKRQLIDDCIDELLENDLIEISNAPCSSPCIVVPKSDGTGRFCVDFRDINSITKPDSYALPLIDNIISDLGKAKYFTVIDLTKGYHQIPVKQSDRWKTSFVTHRGLFQYKAMPFGSRNAPACFQRAMDKILGQGRHKFCLVYIDDIIIFSETREEHLKHLKFVLNALLKANLHINPKKLQLLCKEFKFLGFVFKEDEKGIMKKYPNPKKVIAITKFPTPKNQKDVSRLVGMMHYYCQFVPNYAILIKPITKLLGSKYTFKFAWSLECETNLRRILEILANEASLFIPNFNMPFEIHCDACDFGIAAVLLQLDPESGELKPISFRSRHLNEAEKKMCTTHKERLAVKFGLDKFKFYVEYSHFTIVTDHQALEWLMTTKDLNGKLARWAATVQEFDFRIKYRPGRIHERADTLSRAPVEAAPIKTTFHATAMYADGMLQKISNDAFIAAQNNDPLCIALFEHLKDKTKLPTNSKLVTKVKLFGKFCYNDKGLLLRYLPDWNANYFDYFRACFKIIVPDSLKNQVLELAHEHRLAGHAGRDKTLTNLLQAYWWSGVVKDVADYVMTCNHCQLNKAPNSKQSGDQI